MIPRLLLMFALAVPFALGQNSGTRAQGTKPLTIESIFAEGGLTGRGPENVAWSPDGTKVSFVQRDAAGDHGELWYVDAASGDKKVLVSESKLATLAPPISAVKDEREKERLMRYHVAAYDWAPDSKHLLFDSHGQLWLYSLDTATGLQFTSDPAPAQDPKFSPDGNHLAYLRNHNLFVKPISGGSEKALTKDSNANILNGEVDWLYEEELSVRSNYFWSPDSKQIVYLQSNETRVPEYPITDWLPTHPRVDQEKYPQPGDPNPSVRIGVVNTSSGKTKWIKLTDNEDTYVPRFGWVREGIIWAEVLNRTQDNLDLYFVDVRSGKSRKVLTESDPTGWVYANDAMKVLKSGDRFTWSSWRTGNTHLYLYSFDKQNPLAADAKLEKQLTQGDFEVLSLDGIDETSGTVYFSCNRGDPRQLQLYSVKLDGDAMTQVSKEEGHHAVTFAEDGKHYLDGFSSLLTPTQLSLCNARADCHAVWGSQQLDAYGLLPPKFLEFKADDGTTLYGKLLLPAAGNGNTKIPLIVNVYGGPAAQIVQNEWGGTGELFDQMLAQKGFALFSVDNRGTPNRDRKFQTALRHQFGAVELSDQLAALHQLLDEVPQLDHNRVALWGWSNGGSMTLYSMTHSDAFKAGASVAPVTDWRNYDSAYTERYMGLPKDNAKGYDDSSMPKAAGNLHGALLLVHGTSDDNVHFQNSIQMIDALIKSGKQFDLMLYPDKTHGIGGADARSHLFHMIENHFERELLAH